MDASGLGEETRAGLEGSGEGAEGGAVGRVGHLGNRKPLVYVTLMCYDDAEGDPVKVTRNHEP